MGKSVYIDFEFNELTDEKVNLVCAAAFDPSDILCGITKFWLHDSLDSKKSLIQFLGQFDTIISYSAVAEARSFISLGLDPLSFKWVDLFLEFRCLTNHNDRLNWGSQLVDGKVKHIPRPKPKWEREGHEIEIGFKHTHSLAEATYKLLGQIRDTDHKNKMRDLIISAPKAFREDEKKAIMEYCTQDVLLLPELHNAMIAEYERLNPAICKEGLEAEMLVRGRYSAHTAIMESRGYPIDLDKTKHFSQQVGSILFDCQKEINDLFPEIQPFKWEKKSNKFRWDQNATRTWIEQNHSDKNWEKTETGALSLSLDAFTKFFDFKHNYPKDNFGAQIVRYLKLKQSLYGFVPSPDKKRKNFWDYVGKDGRVRPYLNIYGSQSSRSQPAATGFMFLKPAWMRALVQPKNGMAMAGIDYGSQEFFLSALISQDSNMIESYLSGDVYLAFGKLAGIIPPDGTKEKFKRERDLCKSTVLGISYLMSKYGLAFKLSQDSGHEWTEDEAQDMIDRFYEAYPSLKEFQTWIIDIYRQDQFLKLPCGWYLFGDNPNERSVANCPIQGFGASIMRKAVDMAVSRGLYVPFTLHDALYIEYPVGQEHQISILADCMREAFAFYFDDKEIKDLARKIRLDPFAWSPDYEKDSEIILTDGMKVPVSNLYIDERAIADWDSFSKYFNAPDTELI